MNLAQMKKNRKKKTEKLQHRMEQDQQTGGDDRFWKAPAQDKAGNAYAVIRFLPPSMEDSENDGDEAIPYMFYHRHMFRKNKNSKKWYVERCPHDLEGDTKCPACEANSELWDTKLKANEDIARNRKRQLKYIANIKVLEDKLNPENEGKVFLYEFGKSIFDIIQDKLMPEFEDEEAVNIFDFWDGADFKLKVRDKEGYVNYDKSEFKAPTPLSEDDAEIEKIWKEVISLAEFRSEDNYKSYDDLKKLLDDVLGNKSKAKTIDEDPEEEDEPDHKPAKKEDVPDESTEAQTDEDDDMDYFQNMLDD